MQTIQDRWVTVKAMAFSSSHVWIWQLDYKAGWTLNNWCFWIVVLEKMLESSLGCKDNKPINLRGNQSWVFIRRTDVEVLILWPPYAKSHLTGKDTNAGKDWKQKKKKETENEMVGWHQWLNGHEFEQTLGDGEGQGSLVCCSPWGHKESDTTWQLNNSNCFLHITKHKW